MTKIDVTDEALIDSPPLSVYKTILNELSGVTQWWMPHLKCKSRDGKPIDHEGAIFDATIHPESRMRVNVSTKVTKIVEAKSIELEYAGDFKGTGKYTFESTNGKTKLTFRFNVKTNKLLFSLLSPFIDTAKAHSEVMQQGFKACNNYLKQKNQWR